MATPVPLTRILIWSLTAVLADVAARENDKTRPVTDDLDGDAKNTSVQLVTAVMSTKTNTNELTAGDMLRFIRITFDSRVRSE